MDLPFRHASRLKFVNFRLPRAVWRHIFGNVRLYQNESALELFDVILENTWLKGSFWWNNWNFELAPDSRYLQWAALRSRCLRKPGRVKRWVRPNLIILWALDACLIWLWTVVIEQILVLLFRRLTTPFVLGPREPKWRPKSDQLRDEKIPTFRWFLPTNFSATLSWLYFH